MMIPKFTAPEAKLIRTLEGIVLVASNIALAIVPIITSSVPASLDVKLGCGLNAVAFAARQAQKAVLAIAQYTGTKPDVNKIPPAA